MTAAKKPRIPAAALDAAMEAAWPGLPEGMTAEEARDRTERALQAALPHLMEDRQHRDAEWFRQGIQAEQQRWNTGAAPEGVEQ